jgi:predicted kinase
MARDSQGSRRCSTPTASRAVDVYAEPHADPSGQTELVKAFVLVGGWPGSGKTTLARPLATELGVAFLSKDEVKETLMDRLGAPVTVEQSREVGVAAVAAVLRVARGCPAAVPLVELRCRVDVELARERYHRRVRDARYLDGLRTEAELWGAEVAPLGVDPLIEVDTAEPVDVVALAQVIRATVERGGRG